ncbi:MAG: PQQ-like beta-propeller repeat protein [Planctomycetes bacterium]|nr:PQQ-like beta-propeller repeat protein [Planctomycetota bacterium]
MLALAAACGWIAESSSLRAGDWPQILGPNRDGRAADDERLASSWPSGRPPVRWQRPVGRGFAGVAVAGGKVLLFHRMGDQELVEAMDARTGVPLWKAGFPTRYVSTISEDNGPRCVPVIHDGAVYVVGAGGDLHSLTLDSGQTRWSRATSEELNVPDSYFGAGSSPLIEGDKLLVNVGGRSAAGVVAFSLADGKTIWKSTDEGASYSSPVAVTLDGVRHAIFVTRFNVVSLDPANGQVRFRLPFGMRGPTVNGANPLVIDGHLFLSASYGVGAVFAKIGKDALDVIWTNDDTMSSQYATCVRHEGHLYGIDGRQDIGVARLRCFDPRTQKVLWTQEGFGMATLILADGKLLMMKTDGELVIAEATPTAFRQLASARLFSDTAQALPALSNGLLYVRDTGTLKCVDLGERSRESK